MAFWKITYISALKIQMMLKTFIRISSNPIPYPDQEKKLNALIKAEKAMERANKQKVAVKKLLNAERKPNVKLVLSPHSIRSFIWDC